MASPTNIVRYEYVGGYGPRGGSDDPGTPPTGGSNVQRPLEQIIPESCLAIIKDFVEHGKSGQISLNFSAGVVANVEVYTRHQMRPKKSPLDNGSESV
ncbi:MAG TPA: hypothetical protein VNL14_16725 [Candidatus Acidoferrales bacterium]|nr:hypothetical protein [Candidatus Acidoferrales bacterium]